MTKPAFSLTTWNGDHTSGFDGIREDGGLASYQEIPDRQFSRALAESAAKMEEIKEGIKSMEQMIAQLLANESAPSF